MHLSDLSFQLIDFLLLRRNLRVFTLHDLIQALNGGQCNTFGIYGIDVFVICANIERGIKILCHWADVLSLGRIILIKPLLNGQANVAM